MLAARRSPNSARKRRNELVDIREDLFFPKELHLDVVHIRLGLRHAELLETTDQGGLVRLSALGQKRTFRSAIVMSALPPKADIPPKYEIAIS